MTWLRPHVAIVMLLVLILPACSGGERKPPVTPDTPLPATRTSPPGAQPSLPSEVEKVADALVAGGLAAIWPLLELTPTPCTTHFGGIGDPPLCPAGVAEGSLIGVFRASGCDGVYPEDLARSLTVWTSSRHVVYAVYEYPDFAANGWIPAADYAIVLIDVDAGDLRPNGSVFHVSAGKIVGALLGCNASAADLVAGIAPSRFIVAPPP